MKRSKIEYIVFSCVIIIFIVENICFFYTGFLQSIPTERRDTRAVTQNDQTKARIEMISMIESFKLNGEKLTNCYLYPVNKDNGKVENDSLVMSEALGNYTILLHFSQYGCNTCIREVLENMQETFADSGDKCKIMILTDKLTKYFSSYLEKENKKGLLNVYETNQQTIVNNDNEMLPYIALVDPKGYILSALSFSPKSLVYVKYFNQMCKKKIEL